ncbi:hypothetical protein JKP88DRAFT_304976 [Tribonema minus]|uniref:Ion transport domain-containing protein n=1 Tax=Tribonema minus TaxID=303371 RepID=A0A835ZBE0_9STRA|nr:hypothetical protein JKP88DRAFT_304976 [Tribonema minus]
MLGVSLAGALHTLVWYSVAVLDVVPQSRIMTFVLDAVRRNTGKIAVTVLLLLMSLYFYAIVSWLVWPGQYELNQHGGCDSILSCWLLHIDYGLLDAPSWDNYAYANPEMPPLKTTNVISLQWYDMGTTLAATLFQLTYYIVVNLVMGAILAGLIIDTFSEMRQESERKDRDIRDKCFICSLDRDSFEQVGVVFQTHITEEHNLWKYVWFKLYLEQKDPLAYTGPEHHAAQLFRHKNEFVRLIPIKKALAFRRTAGTVRETQDLTTVYSRVKELGEGTSKLTAMLSTRFQEQEEDSKRLRLLTKQGERMERTVRQLERRLEEAGPRGGHPTEAPLPGALMGSP